MNRHQPLAAQHQTLSQKLRGHFAYYGITGNAMRWGDSGGVSSDSGGNGLAVANAAGEVSWDRFYRLLERYPLPPAIVVHSVYRHVAKIDMRSRVP